MTILLDTSVVIELDRLAETEYENEPLAVSAVTVAELAFGVEEAKLYGVLATLVRGAGRNPRPRRMDLQIAATAAAARLPLLTLNAADFHGIGPLVDVVDLNP